MELSLSSHGASASVVTVTVAWLFALPAGPHVHVSGSTCGNLPNTNGITAILDLDRTDGAYLGSSSDAPWRRRCARSRCRTPRRPSRSAPRSRTFKGDNAVIFDPFNACNKHILLNSQVAVVIASSPLTAGEIGGSVCSDSYLNPLPAALGVGYKADLPRPAPPAARPALCTRSVWASAWT